MINQAKSIVSEIERCDNMNQIIEVYNNIDFYEDTWVFAPINKIQKNSYDFKDSDFEINLDESFKHIKKLNINEEWTPEYDADKIFHKKCFILISCDKKQEDKFKIELENCQRFQNR